MVSDVPRVGVHGKVLPESRLQRKADRHAHQLLAAVLRGRILFGGTRDLCKTTLTPINTKRNSLIINIVDSYFSPCFCVLQRPHTSGSSRPKGAGFQVVKELKDKSKLALAINGQLIGEWFKR